MLFLAVYRWNIVPLEDILHKRLKKNKDRLASGGFTPTSIDALRLFPVSASIYLLIAMKDRIAI